jgi:predicted acylesterase/phospholipase RssA
LKTEEFRKLDTAVQSEKVREALQRIAQEGNVVARSSQGRYSLVTQGGVSLGSWQAGYTYYLSELLKLRRDELNEALPVGAPPRAALRSLAGASAGAINAFAAGLESCRVSRQTRRGNPQLDPRGSLFYKVWVRTLDLLGNEGLFPKGQSPSSAPCSDRDKADAERLGQLGLFSTQPLCNAVALARAELQTGEQLDGCEFNYGLSLTHLEAVNEPVYQVPGDGQSRPTAIEAKRLTEYVTLQVRPGLPAPFKDLAPLGSRHRLSTIRLSDRATGTVPVDSVLQAVRASGAFPVAFPPVHLRYETARGEQRESDFVDGGTLDNTPVALAAAMNDWRADPSLNPWLSEILPQTDDYFIVNPNVVSWTRFTDFASLNPDPRSPKKNSREELLGKYVAFAGEMLATGTDSQLVNAARQLEWLGEGSTSSPSGSRGLIPRRNLPIAGEQFAHFMAFLEEDFRVFDFFVGVLDAIEHTRTVVALQEYEKRLTPRLRETKDPLDAQRFACLEDYYQSHRPTLSGAPSVLLAQATASSEASPGRMRVMSPPASCDELGNFRAMLIAMHNLKVWSINPKKRQEDLLRSEDRSGSYDPTSEFDQFFRELEAAGYQFTHDEFQGGKARLAFRNVVQRAIQSLVAKHSGAATKLTLDAATRLAADTQLVRTFPAWYWHLGYALNGVEAGVGYTLWNTNKVALRLDARQRVYRLGYRTVRAEDDAWGGELTTYAGLTFSDDLQNLAFTTLPPGALDWELSLGATYAQHLVPFGALDSWFPVARFGASAGLGAVILQRLYLKLDAELYPENPGRRFWVREEAEDTELVRRLDALRFNFAIGWRFLD